MFGGIEESQNDKIGKDVPEAVEFSSLKRAVIWTKAERMKAVVNDHSVRLKINSDKYDADVQAFSLWYMVNRETWGIEARL